jgi:hypothetical protein
MYLPDPGGVFESDTHRRVLSHVPDPPHSPMTLHPLGVRIQPDRHHGLSHVNELEEVLGALEACGYVAQDEGGFITTDAGLEALCAPAPEAPAGTEVKPALIAGLDLGLAAAAAPPAPEPEEPTDV